MLGFQQRRCMLRFRTRMSPHPACLLAHHFLSWFATECLGKIFAVLDYPDDAELARRMRIRLHLLAHSSVGLLLTPDLTVSDKQSLLGSESVDGLRGQLLSATFSRFGLLCL